LSRRLRAASTGGVKLGEERRRVRKIERWSAADREQHHFRRPYDHGSRTADKVSARHQRQSRKGALGWCGRKRAF